MVEIAQLESTDVALRTSDSWNSQPAHQATRNVFIFREPPSLTFLKINFDNNIIGIHDEVGFIIRGPDSILVTVGGCHLFGLSRRRYYELFGLELFMQTYFLYRR